MSGSSPSRKSKQEKEQKREERFHFPLSLAPDLKIVWKARLSFFVALFLFYFCFHADLFIHTQSRKWGLSFFPPVPFPRLAPLPNSAIHFLFASKNAASSTSLLCLLRVWKKMLSFLLPDETSNNLKPSKVLRPTFLSSKKQDDWRILRH